MVDPPLKKRSTSKQKKLKKKKNNNVDPPIHFFSLHGNGETIRIGREIQCLPYAGFLLSIVKSIEDAKKNKNCVNENEERMQEGLEKREELEGVTGMICKYAHRCRVQRYCVSDPRQRLVTWGRGAKRDGGGAGGEDWMEGGEGRRRGGAL